MPRTEEFRYGCDCIDGFVMSIKGICIPESQCNLWEAFGFQFDTRAGNQNAGTTEEKLESNGEVKPDTELNEKDVKRPDESQGNDFIGSGEDQPIASEQIAGDVPLTELNFREFIPFGYEDEFYGEFTKKFTFCGFYSF